MTASVRETPLLTKQMKHAWLLGAGWRTSRSPHEARRYLDPYGYETRWLSLDHAFKLQQKRDNAKLKGNQRWLEFMGNHQR